MKGRETETDQTPGRMPAPETWVVVNAENAGKREVGTKASSC